MKLKVLVLSASVALLAVTGSVSAGNPKSVHNAIVVSTKSTYAPESVEAQSVLQWVTQRSPEYAPVLSGVTVEVVRKIATTPKSPGAATTAAIPPPPVPLPNHGNPGDEFTITTTDRFGNSETWGYTWVNDGAGGGWQIAEYHYKSVITENQDSPETLG